MLVKTSPEQAHAILASKFKSRRTATAEFHGTLNFAEGSATLEGIDGQPVTYWLAMQGPTLKRYLTTDEKFGDGRFTENWPEPIPVSLLHWGDDMFYFDNMEHGTVFGPFRFHE